uniref:(northern house mosquito) hypothetical protein n=1 Tax=Culex pipiens TaxID=7175 RepID=A0A8D8C8L1_CULPI
MSRHYRFARILLLHNRKIPGPHFHRGHQRQNASPLPNRLPLDAPCDSVHNGRLHHLLLAQARPPLPLPAPGSFPHRPHHLTRSLRGSHPAQFALPERCPACRADDKACPAGLLHRELRPDLHGRDQKDSRGRYGVGAEQRAGRALEGRLRADGSAGRLRTVCGGGG